MDLSEPTVVLLQASHANHDRPSTSGASSSTTLLLTALPPILLDVSLPQAYPYVTPQIRTVHATHSWLPQVGTALRDHLARKWESGEGVLYTWVEWVRTGEFLDDLRLTEATDGQRTIRSVLLRILGSFPNSSHASSAFHILRRVSYTPFLRTTTSPPRQLAFLRIRTSVKSV